MKKMRLILVGGFLGAGKTTLLGQAGRRLAAQGRRIAFVANDQAADLVDTGVLRAGGLQGGEIAGGCFCCRFDSFAGMIRDLARVQQPHVILAEPVGSCTDISATVIQPMKKFYGDRFEVAPFSVLVDPVRLDEAFRQWDRRSPDPVMYIFRKQLEEADLIVLNKVDTVSTGARRKLVAELTRRLPGKTIIAVAAVTGHGVDTWLDRMDAGTLSGRTIAEVNYDVYARGEAALGWLNAAVELASPCPVEWGPLCLEFMLRVRRALRARNGEIAHVKLQLSSGRQGAKAQPIEDIPPAAHQGRSALQCNLTSSSGVPVLRYAGRRTSLRAKEAELVINARVRISPTVLKNTVLQALRKVFGAPVRYRVGSIRSFRPSRPKPTHRFRGVVGRDREDAV